VPQYGQERTTLARFPCVGLKNRGSDQMALPYAAHPLSQCLLALRCGTLRSLWAFGQRFTTRCPNHGGVTPPSSRLPILKHGNQRAHIVGQARGMG